MKKSERNKITLVNSSCIANKCVKWFLPFFFIRMSPFGSDENVTNSKKCIEKIFIRQYPFPWRSTLQFRSSLSLTFFLIVCANAINRFEIIFAVRYSVSLSISNTNFWNFQIYGFQIFVSSHYLKLLQTKIASYQFRSLHCCTFEEWKKRKLYSQSGPLETPEICV